jgi:hypothetical protein
MEAHDHSVQLADRTATGTGPNISSRTTDISGRVLAMTVGGT